MEKKIEDKLFWRIGVTVMLILLNIVIFGIVLPFLISYRDDIMVASGIFTGVCFVLVDIYFGVKIIRSFIKAVK